MKDLIERYGHRVKALLQYIRSSCNRKITYGKSEAKLVGFLNTDYTADKANRKSTLRQVFIFAEGPVL